VVKLNSVGTIEWQNTIGGDRYEELYSIQQTFDGGYILGGHSDSKISGDKTEVAYQDDYWVVKLNSSGVIEWQNAIGGKNQDFLYSIQQTSDGGYILGGKSYSGTSVDKTEKKIGGYDYWVVKLSSTGDIEWQNTIGGTSDDNLRAVRQTADGGYILGGYSTSPISGDKSEPNLSYVFYSNDYWIVKLNSAGTVEWENTIGGDSSDFLYSLELTSDGGYILGGYSWSAISTDKTEPSHGDADYWMLCLNSTGSILWQKTIGGNKYDELQSVHQTADGGYILGGYSDSDISGDKTEASQGGQYNGDYWIITLAAPLSCDIPTGEFTSKITATTVKTNWNAVNAANKYKVRYKPTSTNTWTTLSVNLNYKKLTNLSPATQYDWQVKAICNTAGLGKSGWSATQTVTTVSLKTVDGLLQPPLFGIYPNPFASSTIIAFTMEESQNVTIELFDMAGRKVETLLDENVAAGSHEVNLERRQLPAGMYVLKMKTPSSVATQSIIIQ